MLICVTKVHSLTSRPLHPLSSAPPPKPTPVLYCPWRLSVWCESKLESPRSALRSSQFCAVTAFRPTPSSMAFDKVYWRVEVNPLWSRRRTWMVPDSRVELPLEVRYLYPGRQMGQGLSTPLG